MLEIMFNEELSKWCLYVGGEIAVASTSENVCKRYARIIDHCRNIPYRSAIKILIDDIGYNEEEAKVYYVFITEYRSTGVLQ